jgi:hypothetical protein
MNSQPSPAEQMRAAAANLRETAAHAPSGPWVFIEDLYWDRSAITRETRPDEHFWATLVMDVHNDSEHAAAKWMALMSTALAEPLALLLETIADQYDAEPCDYPDGVCNGCERRDDFNWAADIARVINAGGR